MGFVWKACRRGGVGAVAAGFMVLAAAACSGSAVSPGGHATSSPAARVARSAPSSPARDETTAVAEAYRRFWLVSETLHGYPESTWPRVLGAVAVDPQLSWILGKRRDEPAWRRRWKSSTPKG